MSIVTIGINLRLLLEISSWTVLEHLFVWGSLSLFFLFCIVFSFASYPSSLPASYGWNEYYKFISHTYPDGEFWLILVLGVFLFLLPRLAAKGSCSSSDHSRPPSSRADASTRRASTRGCLPWPRRPAQGRREH